MSLCRFWGMEHADWLPHQHLKRLNVYPVIVPCYFWPASVPVRPPDWLRRGAGRRLLAPGRGSFR